MKQKKIFALLPIIAATIMASCTNDNESNWNSGSQIDLPRTRAFVLFEGIWGQNNGKLTYFNWSNDAASESDMYLAQNGKQLGDVGQDLIYDGTNIFMSVNGSNYVSKLNSIGIEQVRNSFADNNFGQVRNLCKTGSHLYADTYNGSVVKLNADDLSFIDSVFVGSYPEGIAELGGKLYVSVSGWGADSRVAEISISNFGAEPKYIDVMANPDKIMSVNGKVYVQGYGPYDEYWNCPYPWGVIENGKYREIGNANAWCTNDKTIYLTYSSTNWQDGTTINSFYSYDTETGELSDSAFTNVPLDLITASVSGMEINPYTGDIYIMTTLYSNGNGYIYHFLANGQYKSKIPAYGQSPKKIVFLD